MKNDAQPYVGPRPFERNDLDQAMFFGRDYEADELVSLVFAHQVVLFYAQSGAGKTSLLNAGLIPLLEKEGFDVLPVARVQGLIPEGVRLEEISNIFVFNILLGWAKEKTDPRILTQMSITDFMRKRTSPTGQDEQPSLNVLIFDQLEELFTTYIERWKEREEFFKQICAAMEAAPLLRVVFAIREDYMAQIDPYAPLLPEKLRTRFRMERLGRDSALSAIKRPLQDTNCSYAGGIAEALVDDLLKISVETSPGQTIEVEGEFVEPVQLQVVCQNLWNSLPPEVNEITQKHLQACGDVNQALSGFYKRSVERAAQGANVGEGKLRRWFEQVLITPAGTRGTVFRGQEETGRIPNAAVELLENLHIIRGELRVGARWYELTHDRFIEPIRLSNQEWLAERQGAEQIRQRLEAKAAEWARHGRGNIGLLGEVEFCEAERWLHSPGAADLGYSEGVVALIKGSQAEAERERAEQKARVTIRLRRLSIALGLVILVAVGAALIATHNHREARVAQSAAEEARKEADNQRFVAIAEGLVGKALEQQKLGQGQRGALLARQAYLINKRAVQRVSSQIDDALRSALRDLFFKDILNHEDIVSTVGFSPDGKKLASGSDDKIVRLWDLQNPKAEPEVLRGHKGEIYSVAFSPDGETLASGSEDTTIRLWDLQNPKAEPKVLKGHKGTVWSVAFSPDGKTLASGSDDSTVRLWNLDLEDPSDDPVTPKILEGHGNRVWSVAFSPDGKTLASGSKDWTVRLWDLKDSSGDPVNLRGHDDAVLSVAFSPDGKTLASGSYDNTVRLWDMEKPSADPVVLEAHQKVHENPVRSVKFSPDGKTLASGSYDKTVRLWDMNNHSDNPAELHDHEDRIFSVAFSPDGKTLASGSKDKTVRLWNLLRPTLRGHDDAVRAVTISPSQDSKTLASGSEDTTIRLWDLQNPKAEPEVLQGHKGTVWSVALSPDGKTLASGSDDKTVRVWNLDLEDPSDDPQIFEGHEGRIYSVAFSPNGKKLASGSADATIRLRDMEKPSADPQIFEGHEGRIYSVAFSPDGKKLASGSIDGNVLLWDLQNPKAEPEVLRGHEEAVFSVAFSSPDGKTLASGSADKTVRLWDLKNPSAEPVVLKGHERWVVTVMFSPDGKKLASGSSDATIRLWDPKNPSADPMVLKGHNGPVYGVTFSRDGEKLVSGSGDKTSNSRLVCEAPKIGEYGM